MLAAFVVVLPALVVDAVTKGFVDWHRLARSETRTEISAVVVQPVVVWQDGSASSTPMHKGCRARRSRESLALSRGDSALAYGCRSPVPSPGSSAGLSGHRR